MRVVVGREIVVAVLQPERVEPLKHGMVEAEMNVCAVSDSSSKITCTQTPEG